MDADKQVTAVFVQIGNNAGTCTEWAQTDITTNTTIPAGCWLVNDGMHVHNNATLTISPGRRCSLPQGTYLWVSADGALARHRYGVPADRADWPDLEPWLVDRACGSRTPTRSTTSCSTPRSSTPGTTYGSILADLYVTGTSRVSVSHCTLQHSSGLWLRVPRQPDDHVRRQHRHRATRTGPAMSSPGTWAC